MNFIDILNEEFAEAKKVTSSYTGVKIDTELFKNHSAGETHREDFKLQKNKGYGDYIGQRIILVPFKINEKGEKIVNIYDFDDVDAYVWDGEVLHDDALREFDAFKKYKGATYNNIFKGDRPPFAKEFGMGPYFESFDKTSTLIKMIHKAIDIAAAKTGLKFRLQ